MGLPQRKDFEAHFHSKQDFQAFLLQHSSELGIHAWKNNKFAFRQDENTPSCTVNAGWFYDHGSGKSGNIIDLIMLGRGLSDNIEGFKEACRVAEDMLKMPRTADYNGLAANSYQATRTFQPYVTAEKRNEWMNNKTQNRQLFDALFHGLSRNLNDQQRSMVEQKLEIGLSIENVVVNQGKADEFSFVDRRALLPFIDKDNLVWNYCGYNRNSKLKGTKRKDSKPSMAGENFIRSYGKNILWVEGDSDYVHSHGFELNSVTAGSASMRVTQFLPQLHGKDIYFLVDNDMAGATAIARWHQEILEYNKTMSKDEQINGHFLWWSDRSYPKAISEIKRLIGEHFTKLLLPSAEHLTEESIASLNISIMLNDGVIRKKGYDFTDFIEEFNGQGLMPWFKSLFCN